MYFAKQIKGRLGLLWGGLVTCVVLVWFGGVGGCQCNYPCKGDEDCPAHSYCHQNFCRRSCHNDLDCLPGAFCNGRGKCVGGSRLDGGWGRPDGLHPDGIDPDQWGLDGKPPGEGFPEGQTGDGGDREHPLGSEEGGSGESLQDGGEQMSDEVAEGEERPVEGIAEWIVEGERTPEGSHAEGTGGDQRPGEVVPRCRLEVTPLRFAFVSTGETSIRLWNRGQLPCKIVGAEFLPASSRQFVLLPGRLQNYTLASGAIYRFTVRYIASKQNVSATLRIQSDDPARRRVDVLLRGLVQGGNATCLEIMPAVVNFGSIQYSCGRAVRQVKVFHRGGTGCPQSVELRAVKVTSSTSEMVLKSSVRLPHKLQKGQEATFEVAYRPQDKGSDSGELSINAEGSWLPVPLLGQGVQGGWQIDSFRQHNRPAADILFVIDNSSSNRFNMPHITQQFEKWAQWLVQKSGMDYHVGIVGTDVRGGNTPPGCFKGKIKVVRRLTPNPLQQLRDNFKDLGNTGSPSERGLDVAYRALSAPARTQASCNLGFLRANALLSLIFIADEDDQSDYSLDFYVNFFRQLKGKDSNSLLRASAVGGRPPRGCKANGVEAQGTQNYWNFAQRLGGLQLSLCDKNWSSQLTSPTSPVFNGYRQRFLLSQKAIPSSITVRVNGKKQTTGWSYLADENFVRFDSSALPPPSSRIEVTYQTGCKN